MLQLKHDKINQFTKIIGYIKQNVQELGNLAKSKNKLKKILHTLQILAIKKKKEKKYQGGGGSDFKSFQVFKGGKEGE